MSSFSIARFTAVLTASLICCQSALAATPATDVPIVDLRDVPQGAVKKKVAALKPKGLSLAYAGPEDKMPDFVREVSAQATAAGYPVLRVVLVQPEAGEGATLLKPNGDPIGAIIPATTAELRSEARARVALFASERAGAQCSQAPATGSIMRQKKVCNVVRHPEPVREHNAAEGAPQKPGGDATEPIPGS
jgi:hypothetical protein